MNPLDAAAEFARLSRSCEADGREAPLDRASLLISAAFEASVEPQTYLERLDALAERAVAAGAGATEPYAKIGAVLRTLFVDAGFRGNDLAYDDTRNSLLSSVLDRACGIPISLSIVLMEVSRRVGLPLDGIGLPGHFVVRFPDETSRLFIDAFRAGEIIDVAECRAIVDRLYRGRLSWRDDFLERVSNGFILKRVLLNLRNSLSHAKNYTGALMAIEMQLAVDPHDPTELRDRGILFARLRRYDRAIEDLEAYLLRAPDAGDGEHIRNTVQYLRQARNL